MEHIAHAVEHLFRWSIRNELADSAHVVIEAALLKDAIAQTGFGGYMRAIRPLVRSREARLPAQRTAATAGRPLRRAAPARL